jgi:adenylate cyclase
MKIIIVSENNNLIKIEQNFKNKRYKIINTNSTNLIEKATELCPDLFILQNKQGIKNCVKLRKTIQFRYTPIIFITEKYNMSEEKKAYKSGATDYILINIHTDILNAKIDYIFKFKFLQNKLYKKNRELIHLTEYMKKYLPGDLQDELLKTKKYPDKITKKYFAIFFSDIRNFTELSSYYPPEDILDLLNCYLYFTYDRIISNGGKIDKVIGDAILAVFEDEGCNGNPCFAAVKSALEIQKEMQVFNEIMEESPKFTVKNIFPFIQLGIGINYAEVVQGNLGTPDRMDYTVIGDGVNVASRCQSIALGEEIIVTESVYDKIKNDVISEKLPLKTIKGKKEQIQLYKISNIK